jgi:hypothetical protein
MIKKKNNKTDNFFKQIFESEEGYASSKRVLGAIIIFIVLLCIIWLVYTEGGTSVVEDLLNTAMFIGGTLLGISSITGIWKYTNTTNKKENTEIQINEDEDPCENCKYNKQV